ncbi:hypothetical protein SDJN03_11938, partial [Cucurbita argyrosperma subsp. sororia]
MYTATRSFLCLLTALRKFDDGLQEQYEKKYDPAKQNSFESGSTAKVGPDLMLKGKGWRRNMKMIQRRRKRKNMKMIQRWRRKRKNMKMIQRWRKRKNMKMQKKSN